ncbi:MAG: hypothetical protein QM235_00600 [Pseudomonadota bacterium]|jgi:hypothetical protein|nr:hypothetical protein [Pseudomonadota bacterium]
MRDLDASAVNKIVINDARSGTEIELYYRNPTTQEEVEYQTKLYKRKSNKLIMNPKIKLDLGLAILTGFREGDFGVKGKPISSDPESPNYYEDWKGLLARTASDIISTFATVVFEGARVASDTDVEIETVVEEDIPPLVRS